MAIAPTHALNDGLQLPALGLGTYPMDDLEAADAVRGALDLGYRLVDTAASYGNEAGVGQGIATSDVPRDEPGLRAVPAAGGAREADVLRAAAAAKGDSRSGGRWLRVSDAREGALGG